MSITKPLLKACSNSYIIYILFNLTLYCFLGFPPCWSGYQRAQAALWYVFVASIKQKLDWISESCLHKTLRLTVSWPSPCTQEGSVPNTAPREIVSLSLASDGSV